MRYFVFLAALLGGCADWQSVRLATDAPSDCQRVKQLTCVAHGGNQHSRCEKWHKKNALKAGANTIVPLTPATSDYYACP